MIKSYIDILTSASVPDESVIGADVVYEKIFQYYLNYNYYLPNRKGSFFIQKSKGGLHLWNM